MGYRSIAILTGSGVSAESGLGTFREKGGIWSQYNLEDVATPEGFARDPRQVLEFYNARRTNLEGAKPNAAHFALADLQKTYTEKNLGTVTLITQNVDNLHEQGGARNVIHMHGELRRTLCNNCGNRFGLEVPLAVETPCPQCETKGVIRPDVVWFGEMPYHMMQIETVVDTCDLFIAIGTSGAVYPAAGLVTMAKNAGAHTVELNLEPSDGAHYFAEHHYGPASEVVPNYVRTLMSSD